MRLLIAVDGERFARAITDFLGTHSLSYPCEFKVLTVIAPVHSSVEWPTQAAKDEARELVDGVAARIKAILPEAKVETVISQGDPKDEIIKAARDWRANQIVVGSHGRDNSAQFLLGSVSTAISLRAPCSVSIVRLPEEQ